MTEAEKSLAFALAGCTFVPGTGTKRFAKDMADRAQLPDPKPLTDGQRRYLLTAVVRFRRQIDAGVVAMAKALLESEGITA